MGESTVGFDKLLKAAIADGASDMRISAGTKPWLRINGQWRELSELSRPLKPEEVTSYIKGVVRNDALVASLDEGKELDWRFEVENTGVRTNIYRDHSGPAMVMRFLSPKMPELKNLGLPPKVRELAHADKGLLLVTGVTGSGKSTSLAALINDLNQQKSSHIITIEDPIEYVHKPKKSLITQRTVGQDTLSFANGIKSALRQAPDIILIGELRDRETAMEALHAAETGHLVMATVHCGSAAEAANRIVGMFPPEDKEHVRSAVADNLIGVLTQKLVPRADAEKGRVAAAELLVANHAMKNLIRENKPANTILGYMQTGMKFGMITMEQSLKNLARDGIISMDTHQRALSEYKRDSGMDTGTGRE